MLRIDKGTIQYEKEVILKDFDFTLPEKQLNVIVGPNGAGKTSLLRVLSGTQKLSHGKYNSSYNNSIIIPQNPYYPEGLSLFDYISTVYFQHGFKWSLCPNEVLEIEDILKELHLEEKRYNYLNELSSGELQLANIGLCLASKSDFILLDEPTANLDPLNQQIILKILKKLTTQGITIVVIMHDLNVATQYGDSFTIIYKNKSLQQGNKFTIFTEDNLKASYGIKFKVFTVDENIYLFPNF